MKPKLVNYLREKDGISVNETEDFEKILPQVDILYQTRKQKERTDDPEEHRGLAPYRITPSVAERMKDKAFILHPLPRNDELSREVDRMPQAAYIKQMYFGRLIRQALLTKILFASQ
jgi:aspartate carbamoyltransferase catalytic subunit